MHKNPNLIKRTWVCLIDSQGQTITFKSNMLGRQGCIDKIVGKGWHKAQYCVGSVFDSLKCGILYRN